MVRPKAQCIVDRLLGEEKRSSSGAGAGGASRRRFKRWGRNSWLDDLEDKWIQGRENKKFGRRGSDIFSFTARGDERTHCDLNCYHKKLAGLRKRLDIYLDYTESQVKYKLKYCAIQNLGTLCLRERAVWASLNMCLRSLGVCTHSNVLRAAGLCGQWDISLAPADPAGSPHSWSSRAGACGKQT